MYDPYKYDKQLKKVFFTTMMIFIPIAVSVGIINYVKLGTAPGDSFAAGVAVSVIGLFFASAIGAVWGLYHEYLDYKEEQKVLISAYEKTYIDL